MATLPPEIITIILSKLPVISLLRFKCVCKSWYTLLKTPNFIKLHLNQTLISSNPNHLRHLLLYDPTSVYYTNLDDLSRTNTLSFSKLNHHLPFTSKLTELDFIGSCNGVICISSKTVNILLYNPLTRSHLHIPPPKHPPSVYTFTLFGFGYDSTSDDYKVLRIVQGNNEDDNDDDRVKVEVFSVNNNSWTSVAGIHGYYFDKDKKGVLVDGVLHYTVFSISKGVVGGDKDLVIKSIVCFDLRTDSFSVMDCPPWDCDQIADTTALLVRELGGSLCAMQHYMHDFKLRRADIWVMKENGNKESWVKQFAVGDFELQDFGRIFPIVYSKDGRKVLVQIDYRRFQWYDLASNNVETERFTIYGVPNKPFGTGVFVGSLVSFESGKKTLPMKHKQKNDVDKFLSVGFKLRI